MMRPILALSALSILAACSSSGTSPVVTVIKGVILPPKAEGIPVANAGAKLTREKIEAFGLALIRGRIEGEEISNLLTGTAVNGQYVTYISSFRQNITMLGTLVTGTRGMGGDLLAVRTNANDPVAHATPTADWPTTLTRDYRFPGIGPTGNTITVTCNLSRAPDTTVTIVEVTYDVTPFTEVCTGDGVEFTNTYLAQPDTGQIWQTLQWIGDKVGYVNIDVLEPYTTE
jgi:hypothetical protein